MRLPPRAVWIPAAYFLLIGFLQLVWPTLDNRLTFGTLGGALGSGALHGLMAWGLWRRLALCRSVAMVYCIAVLVTHAAVLGMAFAGAPVRFPPSVIASSALEVPSCALLFSYLRSRPAGALFNRMLLGPSRDPQ